MVVFTKSSVYCTSLGKTIQTNQVIENQISLFLLLCNFVVYSFAINNVFLFLSLIHSISIYVYLRVEF